MSKEDAQPVSMALWGAAFFIGGLWFFYALIVRDALDELALIREARVTEATFVGFSEFDGEDSRGDYYAGADGAYQFTVNGKDYYAKSTQSSSNFSETAKVEFLDHDPTVNRMHGRGVQTIREWLLRKVLGGLVMLGFFLAPGIAQLDSAHKAYKRQQGIPI